MFDASISMGNGPGLRLHPTEVGAAVRTIKSLTHWFDASRSAGLNKGRAISKALWFALSSSSRQAHEGVLDAVVYNLHCFE